MIALPHPDVIITHESDLDGLVAGLLLQRLAKKLFNKEVQLQAYHYNFWKLRELRENSAWVTDLTFEARMDRQPREQRKQQQIIDAREHKKGEDGMVVQRYEFKDATGRARFVSRAEAGDGADLMLVEQAEGYRWVPDSAVRR